MAEDFFKKSLDKYSNKKAVLDKWVDLNKRLNRNKDSSYYSRTILDAQSLMEYAVANIIKDENGNVPYKDENGKPYTIIRKLLMTREKGKVIPDSLIDKLKSIKKYRNEVAHNTKTTIGEIIDYDKTEEALKIYGEVLNCLDFLDKENIIIEPSKLKANTSDIIDDLVVLDEFIGEGSSGRVFKGYHKRLGINVAVKEIKHNIIDSEIIENEKKILVSLKHNGIPNIYDVIAENRTFYIIMEYLDGINLEEFMKKAKVLSLNVIIDIGKQLCDIIEYLHNKKIVYNDLKPSNILINSHNKITLIDFGISCDSRENIKQSDKYSGTYVYSSPEQINGEISSSSNDIYALGATLYYIVEGDNPKAFHEQSFKKSTDKRIIYIIEKAMNYNKEDRYESVKDLKEDLLLIEKGKNPLVNLTQKHKNKSVLISAAIILCVILIVSGSIGTYKILSKNNTLALNDKINKEEAQSIDKNDNTSKDNVDSTEENDTKNKADAKEVVNLNENNSASTFNGKLVATVNNYEIDNGSILVNVSIINSYDKEVKFWQDGIYIMNENNRRFAIDIYKHLRNGGAEFAVVPGEIKDFTFYLTDYVDSESLTLKLDKIFCMDPTESMKNTIEIKLK